MIRPCCWGSFSTPGTTRRVIPTLPDNSSWAAGGTLEPFRTSGSLSLAAPSSSGLPLLLAGDVGGWAVAEQQIYRVPNTDDRGIGIFGRISSAPADRNLIDLYVDTGIEFIGLSDKRPDDKFGIAAAYAHISRRAQQLDNDYRHFVSPDWPQRSFDSRPSINTRFARDGRCSRTFSTSSIQVAGRQLRWELFQANP